LSAKLGSQRVSVRRFCDQYRAAVIWDPDALQKPVVRRAKERPLSPRAFDGECQLTRHVSMPRKQIALGLVGQQRLVEYLGYEVV
jgi:hypothetical protein